MTTEEKTQGTDQALSGDRSCSDSSASTQTSETHGDSTRTVPVPTAPFNPRRALEEIEDHTLDEQLNILEDVHHALSSQLRRAHI